MIISSHHDSAMLYRRKEHIRDIYLPLCSLLYLSVLSLFLMLYEALKGEFFRLNLPSVFPLIFIVLSFVLSLLSFRLYSLFSTSYSPGVGDNLSGVGIAVAMAEYFSKRRLSHTRVEIVSFDAEECGAQGSKDYYARNEYPENTININIDGIYSPEDITILLNDGNGLKKLDATLASELSSVANSLGYKLKEGKLSLFSGATDALSASKRGIRAVTITGINGTSSGFAHSAEDTIDKIDIKALERVISLLMKYIEAKDKRADDEKTEAESLLVGKKYRLSPHD